MFINRNILCFFVFNIISLSLAAFTVTAEKLLADEDIGELFQIINMKYLFGYTISQSP
jgi:hypothetical protein